MKEATGELNMTVITVVAIAAIAGIFYAFIWPSVKTAIKNNTCSTFGDGYTYSKGQCCKNGKDCIKLDEDDNGNGGNNGGNK